MPHYIATINTHKIIEVTQQEASKWMTRNATTGKNRLVGRDTVGGVTIKTFLYSQNYPSLDKIFTTRRNNVGDNFHSSTWKQAKHKHNLEVLKEKHNQKT